MSFCKLSLYLTFAKSYDSFTTALLSSYFASNGPARAESDEPTRYANRSLARPFLLLDRTAPTPGPRPTG